MTFWKRAARAAGAILIGFGLGAIATVAYLFIALRFHVVSVDTAFVLRELFGSMIFGAYCGVISFIYSWRRLNYYWQTAVHFPLLLIGFYVAGRFLGWFNTHFLLPFLSFPFIYLLIWIMIYFYHRGLARQLNEKLNKS